MGKIAAVNESILVVDDDPAKRYSMARVLSAGGYQVTEVATGVEAVAVADRHSAVLLDVHLPDLHGFEVCRAIKKHSPATRVVHVSCVYVETVHRAAANMCGADAYLVDPQPEELLATIKSALAPRPGPRRPG